MLSRDVVIVHVLARATLESAQAEGKSELRVSIGIDGFTRSCQAGPWGRAVAGLWQYNLCRHIGAGLPAAYMGHTQAYRVAWSKSQQSSL